MSATNPTAMVDALVSSEKLQCLRSRVHLFGVLPPDVRQWDVDLEIPWFTAGPADRPYVSSNVQLVGSWSSRDGSWLWGDRNTTVSPRGYEALFAVLDAIDELRALRAQSQFELDMEAALTLATWCARKANFAAAWPGAMGEIVALLAVDPIVWPSSESETRNRQWCTFCGKARTEVKALVAGPGVTVCDVCVHVLKDLGTEQSRDTPDVPTMPPCVFCAGRAPRVFTPYASMCFDCIDIAAAALRS